jgi:pimeloyl-ACP methyl ester carboxylesterase
MPTIYPRTKRIPEMNGRIVNGLAVVAHSPQEVLALEGLVESTGRLPGDPLANMYRVLNNAGQSDAIWPWAEDIPPESLANTSAESREGLDARARSLRISLALARTMWRQQRDDVDNLSLALVLPRPGRRATIESKHPALVLDHGSIRARVLAVGGRLRDFGVALFPVARSKRRANVVEALRDNAAGLKLPRLEMIQPAHLDGRAGVVVFLHGLMSTDAGTFDEFVHAMKAVEFGQSVLLVSWPHDTLDSIAANAEDLSVLIEDKLGRSSVPIAFVGHSRGGLVARRTAVELLEIDKARWQPRLRGLVTFGTPHDGAELAERGDELIGKLLLLCAVGTRGGLVPLVDALWSVKDHKKLAGINDLRPRSNGGDFLRELRKAEGRIARKAGAVPLRLYAVGGNVKTDGLGGLMSRRYFGGAAHDLIVTLASAAPASAQQRVETRCDHFGYFTAKEIAGDAASDAIDFLEQVMTKVDQAVGHSEAESRLPKPSRPLKIDPAKVAAARAARAEVAAHPVAT